MNLIRRTHNTIGVMLALVAALALVGVHILHYYSHHHHGPDHPVRMVADDLTGHGLHHARGHAACPVCNMLAHSSLGRGPAPAEVQTHQRPVLIARIQALLRLGQAPVSSRATRAPPAPTA